MTAWPRWILSAATVSKLSERLVVKKAWYRHTSNSPAWPVGFSSGIRRTTSRPGTCLVFGPGANAVNEISATSAREIQRPVASSKAASR